VTNAAACWEVKPLTSFGQTKAAKTGYFGVCFECQRVIYGWRTQPAARHAMTIRRAIAIRVRCAAICGLCSLPVAPTGVDFDHIVPLTRGGADTDANLRVTHFGCDRVKNNSLDDVLVHDTPPA
jgi:5-methylcytosine-specific restriction endonuclease McrA